MRRECDHVGIKLDDFANFGIDLSKELLYTGFNLTFHYLNFYSKNLNLSK